MTSRTTLVAALACVLMFGCNRNVEPFQPGETPREPDLTGIFPDTGTGGPPKPPTPEAGRGAPASPNPRGEVSEARSGEPIQGVVELGSGLGDSARAGGILFIIARAAGARGGPPVAVLRIDSPEFPYVFEIGPENVMIPSMRFAGNLSLSARLDGDGNAMTDAPGDLKGAVPEPVPTGATGVVITLAHGS